MSGQYRKYTPGGFKNSPAHGDNRTGVSAIGDVASFLRVQIAAYRLRSKRNPVTGLFVVVGVIVGLALGSFLNVVVYRTPRHLSVVRPASFCPTCRTEIQNRDNVPVLAWIWLRGKCRNCKQPISWRYPAVEAGTAAAFAGLAATVRPLWGVPGWWLLATTLGVAAVIEADSQDCPSAVTLVGSLLGLVALGVGALIVGHLGLLTNALIGLGAGIIAAVAVSAVPKLRSNIGTGTIWVIPAWGTCLGWLGAWPCAIGCAVALVLASVVTVRIARSERFAHFPLAMCASAGLIAALVTAGIRS